MYQYCILEYHPIRVQHTLALRLTRKKKVPFVSFSCHIHNNILYELLINTQTIHTERECTPKNVSLHLKAGSYPVISPENITFPKHFLNAAQR